MAKFDFLKYLTPKAIINLSVMVGFLIFIVPTLTFLGNEVQERATSLKAQRTEISSRSKTISSLAELRTAAKEAETATVKLQEIIPPRDDLFFFNNYLNNIGARENVSVAFNFTGEGADAGLNTVGSNGFRITSKGSLDNIIDFIETVESEGKFFTNLETVDLTKAGEQFSSSITGLIYFYD